jgi:DNA-binding transcriptional LysR family regulator
MSDLTDREIFARVVAFASMSAAGRDMGLSPAVISKRIKRLEDRLGSRLLQRTTRQVALTEAGQGYYERVVAILASVEEAESFVARRSEVARGTLRISAPTSFGRMHIAPHLGALLATHRDITVHLNLSDALVDLVADGYDLAVRIAALDDSSLVAKRLAPNHRVLVASPGYLDANGTPASLSDLAHFNCLTASPQDTWRLDGPHGPVSVRATGNIQTNSSEVVREAVLAGLGIALRSTWDVGAELKAGRLSVVLPDYRGSDKVGIYAVYPTRRFLPQKVRVFIDFLSDLYGEEPYWDAGLDLGSAGRSGRIQVAAE